MTIGIGAWFLHYGRWTFFGWVYEKMILCNICVPCILRFINVGCFFSCLCWLIGRKFGQEICPWHFVWEVKKSIFSFIRKDTKNSIHVSPLSHKSETHKMYNISFLMYGILSFYQYHFVWHFLPWFVSFWQNWAKMYHNYFSFNAISLFT